MKTKGLTFLLGLGIGIIAGAGSMAISPVLGAIAFIIGFGLILWSVREGGMFEKESG